ncbi:MAG: ABC transporter ATP-binding protein, partial [Bacteroidota bacterium]
LVTISYLFYADWRLALVSLAPLLFLAVWIPYVFTRPKTKALMKLMHESLEGMNGGIVEYVRAMPVMKIFGQTADSFEKYSGTVYTYEEKSVQSLRESAPPFAVFMSFVSNALLPILILGIWLYLENGLGLETLFLFLILGVGYIKPVFALANMGVQITMINRGVQRMDEVLDHPMPEVEPSDAPLKDHSVAFQNVTFAYQEGLPVLENIDFEVAPGNLTALVGPSGAGKSTIAQLIARYWDIQEGQIRIGGRSIRTFAPEALMEEIAYVFQDNFVFQLDMYENIRMGMKKSREEVEAAARAAQCHDFILRMPQGYSTVYGAEGVHLSGGEKQRIQIARAILKDAPILILDEATAFSDPENENLIQQAISHLIQNKTVIIIAHRLNTIMHADQIILLDQGRILARGTHEELLRDAPLYQRMWQAHTRTQSFAIR